MRLLENTNFPELYIFAVLMGPGPCTALHFLLFSFYNLNEMKIGMGLQWSHPFCSEKKKKKKKKERRKERKREYQFERRDLHEK